MFIFRIEHDRKRCVHSEYREGSVSNTGHGPMVQCNSINKRPNFGGNGNPPRIRMMKHERCAVTADQFNDWISFYNPCRYTDAYCWGSGNCLWCPPIPTADDLSMPDGWVIMAYHVEDDKKGIDWRIDENQIVFNHEFVTCMGTVSRSDMNSFRQSALA